MCGYRPPPPPDLSFPPPPPPPPSAPEDFVSLAEMEDALLKNLFRGYQKWVRPVLHANDTITVRFGLKISQLVDVVRNHTYGGAVHGAEYPVHSAAFATG